MNISTTYHGINTRVYALALLGFMTPLAVVAAIDIMSSWKLFRGRSRRRSFVKKYSILEEEDSQASVDIPESEDNSNIGTWNAIGLQRPLVIAMVGLPARGKSYIVKMIIRYLRWIGFESEVFNVGSYRRLHGKAGIGANFFSGDDKEASKSREEMAMAVQEMMYEWLRKGDVKGRVAIFDATNTTVDRRHALCLRARREQVSLLFVESICDDKSILERNYSLKLQNDDYKDQDPSEARKDFLRRVDAYEKRYHTIEDDEDSHQISYIKLINVGQKVISRNCFGYLPSQVAFYLQNIHIVPRSIYLTLPAENSDSVASILGGDSPKMTASGRQYTLDLAKFVQMQNNKEDMLVLTGTAKIHALTSLHLRMQVPVYTTNLLNELRGGDFHLMKREEIKVKHRAVYEARQKNKLHYRYPGFISVDVSIL